MVSWKEIKNWVTGKGTMYEVWMGRSKLFTTRNRLEAMDSYYEHLGMYHEGYFSVKPELIKYTID